MTEPDNMTRAAIAKERAKFEKWMRKRWGGVSLETVSLGRHAFEYKENGAQTAWEVWQKFCVNEVCSG